MADHAHFTLHAFWRTSATFRVRVALNLKGMVAHEHLINLDAGEQHSAAYRQINPMGGIPALVEPDHPPITQSLAILEFLEETQPLPLLLPSDRRGRARVRSLAGMLASDTHPLITPRVKKYLTTAGVFCHGDQATMADICLASVVAVMQVFKISVPDTPTIDRIVAHCSTLDAFARAAPHSSCRCQTRTLAPIRFRLLTLLQLSFYRGSSPCSMSFLTKKVA